MAFISHLFGSLAPSKSVGNGSENKPADVKVVKALLNTYLRSKTQPALPMSDSAEGLASDIEDFQKNKLHIPKPDGRVDPGGKTLTGLVQHLRSTYTVISLTPPTQGRLTWDAEGEEGGSFHSRRLHVPDGNSGLTLGRGFDMRARVIATVQSDLANAGLTPTIALKLSAAAGKWGADASRFVIENDLLDYEIAPQAQVKLFAQVYREKLNEVKRVSELASTIRDHGKVDWIKLNRKILDVLVDLIYRGDYTKTTRTFLQRHVANNDLQKFKIEISKKSNWPNVPADRFKRRKQYLETAA